MSHNKNNSKLKVQFMVNLNMRIQIKMTSFLMAFHGWQIPLKCLGLHGFSVEASSIEQSPFDFQM